MCPASCVSIVIRTVSVLRVFVASFLAAGFLAFGLVGVFLLAGFFVVIGGQST